MPSLYQDKAIAVRPHQNRCFLAFDQYALCEGINLLSIKSFALLCRHIDFLNREHLPL